MTKKNYKNIIIIFIILALCAIGFFVSKKITENNKEIEKIVSTQSYYNDITEKALKESIKQEDLLNDKEKESILNYIDDNYYPKINGYLRGEIEDISQSLKNDIKNIDNSLKKTSLPEDMLLYRGVKSDFIEKVFKDKEISKIMKKYPSYNAKKLKIVREFLINKTFVEYGFMSTSYNSNNIFKTPILLKINAPKGLHALALEDIAKGSEQEILINKGYKWKITEVLYSISMSGKRVWDITLELCNN